MTLADDGIELLDVIGRGGFGTVHRGHQASFGRDVAVKVLATRLEDQDVRARFARECRAIGSLSGHPNIVTVHGSGLDEDDRPYLVMELLPGGSLSDRIRAQGPMDWLDVVPIGLALAGALDEAHRRGVLHRDLKPANVLLSRWGAPKLADFGIARIAGEQLTTSRTVTASLLYAAPEVLAGEGASEHSDLHGLAGTLHTLLAGRPAFAGDTDESPLATITRVMTQDPPDLRRHGVPGPVADVLARAMARPPEERFASASAFGDALATAASAAGADTEHDHTRVVQPPAAPDGAAVGVTAGTTPEPPPAGPPPGVAANHHGGVELDDSVRGGEQAPSRGNGLVAAVAVAVLVGGAAAALPLLLDGSVDATSRSDEQETRPERPGPTSRTTPTRGEQPDDQQETTSDGPGDDATALAEADAVLTAAAITGADLPSGWSALSGDASGTPATFVFCDAADPDQTIQPLLQRTAGFAHLSDGVAVHRLSVYPDSESAEDAFAAFEAAMVSCDRFTVAGQGAVRDYQVLGLTTSYEVGDDTLGTRAIMAVDGVGAGVAGDVEMLRRGRAVSWAWHTSPPPLDPDVITAVHEAAEQRLVGAVQP